MGETKAVSDRIDVAALLRDPKRFKDRLILALALDRPRLVRFTAPPPKLEQR